MNDGKIPLQVLSNSAGVNYDFILRRITITAHLPVFWQPVPATSWERCQGETPVMRKQEAATASG